MSGRPGTGADPLGPLVARARAGDRPALEDLLRGVQDDVYRLALRMLWHPADAEDATQEILIKVLTRLDGFRSESSVRTWVLRVAANHLLSLRRRDVERQALSFERFGADLLVGLSEPGDLADGLLAEEVKLGCTQAMLQCLDREHRLSYVLGEVFSLPSREAAQIANVTPATHRKRLSRARERIQTFVATHCGLVNPEAACRCRRRIRRAVELGRVVPDGLLFATHPRRDPALAAGVEEMERLHDAAALLRSHPRYAAPDRLVETIAAAVAPGRLGVLDPGTDPS